MIVTNLWFLVGIVSITEEELSRLPFETAANVFVENEYVVELNVFHQLHCLVWKHPKVCIVALTDVSQHGLREQLWNPRHISWQNDEPVGWWEFHMSICCCETSLNFNL